MQVSRSKRVSSGTRPLIALANCSIVFDGHAALDEVSFELRRAERWAVLGANGAGKTLLLKMLRGDVWPTPTGREQRSYALAGQFQTAPEGLKHLIAYVGPERQDKYVRYHWDLTVLEVVTTGLFDEDIPLSRPSARQRSRVARVLKRFGLWRWRARRILTLSYGQRRLVLVARAFVSGAQVLLLDEVFNGLDERVRRQLRRALDVRTRSMNWVLTSHRPHELPRSVTHIAVLKAGRIVQSGPKRAVRIGAPQLPSSPRHSPLPTSLRRARDAPGWLVRIRDADLYRDYRRVLRDVNWTVNAGEHWAILGPNGSGKSTLLSLIYGDLHPALGGVVERRGAPPGTPIALWKRRVSWISPELQADHYLAHSIEEIVISGRYASVGLNSPPNAADRRAAARWLQFFGIESLAQRRPRQVSYGQLRLALLARAMINAPRLLLLDEPCTGLAREVRRFLLAVLEQLARSGTQIIMAVHDPEDLIPSIHNVLRIKRGRVEVERIE